MNRRTYNSWAAMMQRCYNSNTTDFQSYGKRGIKVARVWWNFSTFLEDMGERPLNTSLGRINNELGYSKENCRWETAVQQACNKRNSRLCPGVSYDGYGFIAVYKGKRLGYRKDFFEAVCLRKSAEIRNTP